MSENIALAPRNGHDSQILMRRSDEKRQTMSQTRAALMPRDYQEAAYLAEVFFKSRLFRGAQNVESAMTVMMIGMDLGLTPSVAMRGTHIIEGKPSLSADLMLGVCLNCPDVCRYFSLVESNDRIATYETLRVGAPNPVKMSFTIEQAKRAGLTNKDNWKNYPEAMLRARCIGAVARAVYPDLLGGLYTPDEQGDQSMMATEVDPSLLVQAPESEYRRSLPSPVSAQALAAPVVDAELMSAQALLIDRMKSLPEDRCNTYRSLAKRQFGVNAPSKMTLTQCLDMGKIIDEGEYAYQARGEDLPG